MHFLSLKPLYLLEIRENLLFTYCKYYLTFILIIYLDCKYIDPFLKGTISANYHHHLDNIDNILALMVMYVFLSRKLSWAE